MRFRTTGLLIALFLAAVSVVQRAQATRMGQSIVVPFETDGLPISTVRLLADKLAQRASTRVVIENPAGRASSRTAVAGRMVTRCSCSRAALRCRSLLKSMRSTATAPAPISTASSSTCWYWSRPKSPLCRTTSRAGVRRRAPRSRKDSMSAPSSGGTQNVASELLLRCLSRSDPGGLHHPRRSAAALRREACKIGVRSMRR